MQRRIKKDHIEYTVRCKIQFSCRTCAGGGGGNMYLRIQESHSCYLLMISADDIG